MNARAGWRHIVNAYPCPVCDAGPGHDCTSQTGKVKGEPHAARSRLASAGAWQDPEADAYITSERSGLP